MALYLPLVLAALSGWKQQRLYLALDTTVLWDRRKHDSPVSGVNRTGNTVVVAGGANVFVPPLLLASISRYCAVLGRCCGIIRM